LRPRPTPEGVVVINNGSGKACDPGTVGQFTDMLDRNGKEIYEDDIVWWQGNMYVVGFDSGPFYAFDASGSGSPLSRMARQFDKEGFCKIVGNIHDTPDFFEKYHGSKES